SRQISTHSSTVVHSPDSPHAGCTQSIPSRSGQPTMASAGQTADAPVHFSATSHSAETAARQTVVLGARTSAGHVAEVPLHFSAPSHAPALLRHVRPAAFSSHSLLQHAPPSHSSPDSTTPLPQPPPGRSDVQTDGDPVQSKPG